MISDEPGARRLLRNRAPFSATHSETRLELLLTKIKQALKTQGAFETLKDDFDRVYQANEHIERTVALRYIRNEYRKWVQRAGFEITHLVPSTYGDAVMLVHASKIN